MAGCVCVCMRAALCVRLCECVTCSWFELCGQHAHPGSVLQGNVGVVSARPLTLGLSTCITHTRTCPPPHSHPPTHTHPHTYIHTHIGREKKIYKRAISTKTHTHGHGCSQNESGITSHTGTRIPGGRGVYCGFLPARQSKWKVSAVGPVCRLRCRFRARRSYMDALTLRVSQSACLCVMQRGTWDSNRLLMWRPCGRATSRSHHLTPAASRWLHRASACVPAVQKFRLGHPRTFLFSI